MKRDKYIEECKRRAFWLLDKGEYMCLAWELFVRDMQDNPKTKNDPELLECEKQYRAGMFKSKFTVRMVISAF